jgi:spermidine synthase
MKHASNTRRTPAASARWLRLGVLGAFFVSGLCGLVQEVAWTRLLRHVMGNSTLAITTVLCVFMGGLALGSWLGGRWVDRRRDPLRVFAVLEGSIGLYCFFLPWLIPAMQPLVRTLYQHTEASYYVFSLIRFALSGAVMLVPTVLMGATLPVLARFLASAPRDVGGAVGRLYAVNTFGAVAGAAGAGFLLLPYLGTILTIRIGCILSGLVCATALILYYRSRRLGLSADGSAAASGITSASAVKSAPGEKSPALPPEAAPCGRAAVTAVLVGYGLSGFAALVLEIAWTRVLSLMIGSSAYAFSLMVTAFILGLAIGSAVLVRWVDRVRDPLRLLARIEVAIALASLAVVPLLGELPITVTKIVAGLKQSFWLLEGAEFALVLAIMLVPTTLMGAALPVAMRVYARGSATVGRSVGTLYASNTLGSIVGSFAAGFLLIPAIGLQATIVVAAGAHAVVGAVLLGLGAAPARKAELAAGRTRRLAAGGLAIGTVAAAALLIPSWNPADMSSGPFIMGLRASADVARDGRKLREDIAKYKILYHNEGQGATVTVKETADGVRSLWTGGKADATTHSDAATQLLLAHVPLLLHPDPQDVCVIGLASGMTLGSAACYPVKTLDCVEIAPAMVEACRWFDPWNRHVLDDPRVRIILNDGRNHLAMTAKRYDVIISEPSNPWIAGIGDLFTREFFEICRDRLNDRGIACVWINAYETDSEAFRSVVGTFRSVFPEMTIWSPLKYDYILIGSKAPLAVDYAHLAQGLASPAVAEDLLRSGIRSPAQFLGRLAMDAATAGTWTEGAPVHTDDNALMEFRAARSMLTMDALTLALTLHAQDAVAFPWLAVPAGSGPTPTDLKAAVAAERKVQRLTLEAMSELTRSGTADAVVSRLAEAARIDPADPDLRDFVQTALAPHASAMNQWPPERAELGRGVLVAVGRASFLLAQQAQKYGQFDIVIQHDRQALGCLPDLAPAMNDLALALATHPEASRRRPKDAIHLAEAATTLTGDKNAAFMDTLGIAYAAAGQFDNARKATDMAVALWQVAGDARHEEDARARLERYKKGEAGGP